MNLSKKGVLITKVVRWAHDSLLMALLFFLKFSFCGLKKKKAEGLLDNPLTTPFKKKRKKLNTLIRILNWIT